MNKPFKCNQCGKSFTTDKGRKAHINDVHTKLSHRPEVGKEGARAVLDSIGEDLSDGAFFALADELGLEIEDLIE